MVAEFKNALQNGIPLTNHKTYPAKELQPLFKTNLPEVTFSSSIDKSNTLVGSSSDDSSRCNKNGKLRKRQDVESADSIVSSIAGKKKSKIPDGGFGWVVVAASFVVSLIADGVSFSFGLVNSELLTYFKQSTSKTAWVGSLFLAVPLMVGPIMSNLVDKYGCRKMTIVGGLLSSAGFALASISNSIEMLYITFGIISGIGLGIGYVTAVVSIAFWFDKNRTFATGIGASGTGIGTFVYAPFVQVLLDEFGWRGATLIVAGTMLNTCVCGCLMRDPEWLIEENRLESRSQSITTFSNSSVCLDEIKKLLETGAPKETVLETLVTTCNTEANQQISHVEDGKNEKKYKSELFLPTYLSNDESLAIEDIRPGSRRSLRKPGEPGSPFSEDLSTLPIGNRSSPKPKNIASVETLSPSEKVSSVPNSPMHTSINSFRTTNETYGINGHDKIYNSRLSLNENLINRFHDSCVDLQRSQRGNSLDILQEGVVLNCKKSLGEVTDRNGFGKPLYHHKKHHHDNMRNNNLRGNVFIRSSNYFKNMRVHRNSIYYRGALLNTHRYRLKTSSCPNIYRNSMTTIAREDDAWYDSFVDIIKSIFDFSLFLELKFFLFNFSTFLLFIWFIIPYFYISEYMQKYGYTEENSAIFISIIGVTNTVGMIFLGYIGDRPWVNISKLYAACLALCGLSIILMPVCITNSILLTSLGAIFGLTFASSYSFTPSILVSLVNLDEFTCAYGLVLLVQGVGCLIGPPLAGVIYDLTLRWDEIFYAAGFFIVLSGVLAYLLAIIEDRDKKREQEQSEKSDT